MGESVDVLCDGGSDEVATYVLVDDELVVVGCVRVVVDPACGLGSTCDDEGGEEVSTDVVEPIRVLDMLTKLLPGLVVVVGLLVVEGVTCNVLVDGVDETAVVETANEVGEYREASALFEELGCENDEPGARLAMLFVAEAGDCEVKIEKDGCVGTVEVVFEAAWVMLANVLDKWSVLREALTLENKEDIGKSLDAVGEDGVVLGIVEDCALVYESESPVGLSTGLVEVGVTVFVSLKEYCLEKDIEGVVLEEVLAAGVIEEKILEEVLEAAALKSV
ncbi:hypothetical protein MMC12_005502 [Toensbergia leucococca]|nr:hypothetical protein [Toensbergia leucococca]